MTKRTKIWLLLAILGTVYLVYMVGVAALLTRGFQDHFIFNGLNFTDNTNSTAAIMDWIALLDIILWISWGVSFIKDE